MPPVSVLLPIFNGSRYLGEALASILTQTFPDFELVAVNDGSTDASLTHLQDAARRDSRIRIVSRPNTGIVGALNDGLRECRGELVARMDADDVCLPNRFAAQVAFMLDHSRCVALGTDVLYTDPEGAPLIRHRPAVTHEAIVSQLLDGNGGALIHPSVMFRRAALEQVGGYRERYQWIEDLDLYIRLSEAGTLANLPDVHLHYRQHLQSVNRTREKKALLRREIVDPFRHQHHLPDLSEGPAKALPTTPAEWRRHWAYDAARGGYWQSAQKNARISLLLAPWQIDNWRCWRYIRSALRRPVGASAAFSA